MTFKSDVKLTSHRICLLKLFLIWFLVAKQAYLSQFKNKLAYHQSTTLQNEIPLLTGYSCYSKTFHYLKILTCSTGEEDIYPTSCYTV